MGTQQADKKGFRQTEIGFIPEDWQVVSLGEVIEYQKGRKPNRLSNSGSLPYLTAEYFRTGVIRHWVTTDKDVVKVAEDDIVLIWDGSNAGDVFIGLKGVLASTMVRIRPIIESLTRYFIYYFLKTQFSVLNSQTIGSTIPHVNKIVFENLHVPLPPLPEQQKIAFILSKIQQAIQQQDKIVEVAKNLKKSLMHKLFTEGIGHTEFKDTEIGRIPKSWDIADLGDVANQRKELVLPDQNSEIPYVGLEHVDPWNANITRFGSPEEVRSSKYKFYKNDILYGKLRPYLDKAALANFDGICSTDIIVIKTNEKVTPYFLVNLLHLRRFVNYATSTMTGVNHPRTSWNSISKFKLPLPPLPEQQEIARILNLIDKKIETEEKKKTALQQLFKTMLHKLMTGEIRVKDLDLGVSHVN